MNIDLNTKLFGQELLRLNSVPSTNDYVKENIGSLSSGAVVITSNQTAGKGSKGNAWKTTEGKCVAISILAKKISAKYLSILPLMFAIACIKTFQSLGIMDAKIKWVNDIIIGGKKVAGLLCESVIQGDYADVVFGVGINISSKARDFEQLGLEDAGSLFTQTGKTFSLERVIKALIQMFEQTFFYYFETEVDDIAKRVTSDYTSLCLTIGEVVKVVKKDEEILATAKGISLDGSLICERDGKTFKVYHGDASVRGINGYI